MPTFNNLLKTLRPDLYQALCDCDTEPNASKKRVRRSYDKSKVYLDQCLDLKANSEVGNYKLVKTCVNSVSDTCKFCQSGTHWLLEKFWFRAQLPMCCSGAAGQLLVGHRWRRPHTRREGSLGAGALPAQRDWSVNFSSLHVEIARNSAS